MTSDLYRPDRIRALFDEMAATYGTVHLVSSFGLTSRWRKQCLARAALRAGATVVDLMSGMGELWPGIAKSIGSGGRIEAVDLSPVMCGRARAMWTKRNDCPAHLFEGDIFEWDFPRAAADAVVSTFGVKTFSPEQIERLAGVVYELLKPGGSFSFLEISIPRALWLRVPYESYVKYVIPLIGRLFLGNPDNYRMLYVYTRAFGNCAGAARAFADAGLEVREYRCFLGCATGISGRKPG
ncbi:MAG: class I SAM-dependent methyltransferase [Planctomycetota bacterium]|nr:class I SAM-dependent methyltransferase [Planctomycetota bacterium]